jgi:hypothetical protein
VCRAAGSEEQGEHARAPENWKRERDVEAAARDAPLDDRGGAVRLDPHRCRKTLSLVHRRAHETRRDEADPDPFRCERGAQPFGEGPERRLARAVAVGTRDAAYRRERAHEHEFAASSRSHPGERGLDRVDRTGQVDLDDRPCLRPVVEVLVEARTDPGICEDEIERRQLFGLRDPCFRGMGVAHVEGSRVDSGTARQAGLRGRCEPRRIPAGEMECGARNRVCER